MTTKKPVWSHPIEEAAWREKWCDHCFQPDEALKRIAKQGPGCPLLALSATGRLPTQWTRRRSAVMGDTYRCSEYLKKPPVNRRPSSPAVLEPMFDVDPAPLHLVPVEGWPDYRAKAAKDTPEKL